MDAIDTPEHPVSDNPNEAFSPADADAVPAERLADFRCGWEASPHHVANAAPFHLSSVRNVVTTCAQALRRGGLNDMMRGWIYFYVARSGARSLAIGFIGCRGDIIQVILDGAGAILYRERNCSLT